MKIGVICAMQSEFDLVNSTDFGSKNEIHCVLSGIGKVNAALAASILISEFKPDCIINAGVAGSLRAEIQPGDVIVGSQTAYHDVWCGGTNAFGCVEGLPQRFAADSSLLKAASAIQASDSKLYTGLIITGDQFYINEEEDERQRQLYPDALAVDMESAAIAQVCHLMNVPFLSFRIISDSHSDGDQGASYDNFWKTLSERSFKIMSALFSAIS